MAKIIGAAAGLLAVGAPFIGGEAVAAERPRAVSDMLRREIVTVKDWRYWIGDAGAAKPEMDDSAWKSGAPPAAKDNDKSCWLRKTLVLDDETFGFSVKGMRVILKLGGDLGDGVTINGQPLRMFELMTGRFLLAESAIGGERFDILIKGVNTAKRDRLPAAALLPGIDWDEAAAEFRGAAEFVSDLRPGDAERGRKILEEGIGKIDFKARQNKDYPTFLKSVGEARAALGALNEFPKTCWVSTLYGHGGRNITPTACRPFGLASIGPDRSSTRDCYSCTHIQGTGGGPWNYYAPAFLITKGDPKGKPKAEPKAGTGRPGADRVEGRADGFLGVFESRGYEVEIGATLRGGLVAVKSLNDEQVNVFFPLDRTPTNSGGAYTLAQEKAGWVVEGYEMRYGHGGTYPIYGRFEFDRAPLRAGIYKEDEFGVGPGKVEQDLRRLIRSPQQPRSGVYLSFSADQPVKFRLGVSFTDLDGARRNLAAEVRDWDLARIRAEAAADWERQLDHVRITGGTAGQRRWFYTALYYANLFPHVFEDVDGRYLDFENKVRTVSPGHHIYATYSGWDTFRAQMPLLALIEPDRYADMCVSLIEMGQVLSKEALKKGRPAVLPNWPIANRAAWCMVGQPIENMLASGRAHGIENVDWKAALELCEKNRELPTDRCLADAYNGTVAVVKLAESLGEQGMARKWWEATLGYRRFYDPAEGLFLKGKPDPVSGLYQNSSEGNVRTYVWYNGMWDPQGLAGLLGGREAAAKKVFDYMRSPSIDMANENDLHVPFLPALWGAPELAQASVRRFIPFMFRDGGGGPGMDDAGAMSAWLVLAQSGIYSINPAFGWYVLTAPAFERVELDLHRNGKRLTIAASATGNDVFVRKATFNGRPQTNPWLLASELIEGGALAFEMGPGQPDWGKDTAYPLIPVLPGTARQAGDRNTDKDVGKQ